MFCLPFRRASVARAATIAAALAICILHGSPRPAAAQIHRFEDRISRQTSEFEYLLSPSVNSAGDVVFHGIRRTKGIKGIFVTSAGGVTSTIAEESAPQFVSLSQYAAINDNDMVAFMARSDAGQWGVFAAFGGTLSTVAVGNDTTFSLIAAYPDLNDNNSLLFTANKHNGAQGLYAYQAGTGIITPVIESSGNPRPAQYSNATINDAGAVAFKGSFTSGGEVLYLKTASGLREVASTRNSEFTGFFGNVHLNDAGEMAFLAQRRDGEWGIYFVSRNGQIIPVADTTSPLFSGFPSAGLSIDNFGGVTFYAFQDNDETGIYSWSLTSGLYKVVETGDFLFGNMVIGLAYSQGGLSDNGKIAFSYYHGGGREGIAVATLAAPEPGALPLLSLGLLLTVGRLLTRNRR